MMFCSNFFFFASHLSLQTFRLRSATVVSSRSENLHITKSNHFHLIGAYFLAVSSHARGGGGLNTSCYSKSHYSRFHPPPPPPLFFFEHFAYAGNSWFVQWGVQTLQWNLLIRIPLGPAVLSFVERLSSFRGDFLQSVYTRVLSACPLLGGLSFFRVYSL